MKRESKGYLLILSLFSLLGLIIYGAYSPARKAQKQQIMCFSFKETAKNEAIERHMHGFATLKGKIPQVVSYSAGKTLLGTKQPAEYDVMHYITFQSEEDLRTFTESEAYRQFVRDNQANWAKTLVINADIRP